MRVTNSMMAEQFLTDSNRSLNRVSKAQQQVNSTKRINNIADDPLATMQALTARNRLSALERRKSSLTTAKSYLTQAETATADINEVLRSAYELTISASSGSKGKDEHQAIARELANLRDELLSIANSSVGNSYIFGGHTTGKPPFSVDASGSLIYNGIDLTALALSEEYEEASSQITSAAGDIDGLVADLDGAGDYYAKNTICTGISEKLNGMITQVGVAYNSSLRQASPNAQGLADLSDVLIGIRNRLDGELTKPIKTEGGPQENCFSIDDCKTILAEFSALTDSSGGPSALKSTLDAGAVPVPPQQAARLTSEAAASTQLKVSGSEGLEITVNGLELLGSGTSNMYCILDKCVRVLNGELDDSLLGGMIGDIQDALSENSTLRTHFGSSLERVDMMDKRYNAGELNYSGMLSEAEDADMAEAIVNWTTAKTVYDAALASGSQMVQTSLLDFLR